MCRGQDFEGLVGLDMEDDFDLVGKVVFYLEYPFSILRWLSIPSADHHVGAASAVPLAACISVGAEPLSCCLGR